MVGIQFDRFSFSVWAVALTLSASLGSTAFAMSPDQAIADQVDKLLKDAQTTSKKLEADSKLAHFDMKQVDALSSHFFGLNTYDSKKLGFLESDKKSMTVYAKAAQQASDDCHKDAEADTAESRRLIAKAKALAATIGDSDLRETELKKIKYTHLGSPIKTADQALVKQASDDAASSADFFKTADSNFTQYKNKAPAAVIKNDAILAKIGDNNLTGKLQIAKPLTGSPSVTITKVGGNNITAILQGTAPTSQATVIGNDQIPLNKPTPNTPTPVIQKVTAQTPMVTLPSSSAATTPVKQSSISVVTVAPVNPAIAQAITTPVTKAPTVIVPVAPVNPAVAQAVSTLAPAPAVAKPTLVSSSFISPVSIPALKPVSTVSNSKIPLLLNR